MSVRVLAALGLCTVLVHPAYAFLEDAEARRAILELRQRFDTSTQETAQMRRSLLDLQSQIESMRREIAQLTGANEQLERQVAELQSRQKDLAKGLDDRLRRFEPVQVQVDGLEFSADPAEKRDFDAALEQWVASASSLRGNATWVPPTFALALWKQGQREQAVKWYAAAVRTEPGQWSDSAQFARLLPTWREDERALLAEVQQAWASQPPAWP